MNRIEFFPYRLDGEPGPLRGIRVDGRDLREQVADATRELWRRELAEDWADETEDEVERFLLEQHAGLHVEVFTTDHFRTPAPDAFLLGCPCGIWACWPLTARIAVTDTTVTWSDFRQPNREHWGELPLGPFQFDRAAYDSALTP
ncbi:hypothetical protein PV682_19510 [Streptomyces niveiscabiei]|uniref:hypothetical protein n=1 Tax=Streptomyces niveiscabiei TaxID=164115 RepID=UPI0029A5BC63|nr:hypothetical protein [Streptomyces niveiscabiei]MDX3383635.1 hypothetical protein [Streptomyces niveiscabiei]